MNELYIRSLCIDWSAVPRYSYVRDIPALKKLEQLDFRRNITFLVGENGSGKSTLLEAMAIACGLNPEGGTLNYHFSTYDDHSELSQGVRLIRGYRRPGWSFFLRAESFYNAATAANEEYRGNSPLPDYHTMSHGESFLEFVQDVRGPGLYLMDEPEAALSPQRQMSLLLHLYRLAGEGAQFVIATHSPVLLSMPGAEILSFDGGGIAPIAYEDTQAYRVTELFINHREGILRRLLKEEN